MSTRLELPQTTWRRVSPKLMWAELLGTFFGAVVFLALTIPLHLLKLPFALAVSIAVAAIGVITLVLVPRRVRSIGYQLRDDDLLFRRGIMFLRFVAVPYGRMQLVDINRGPVDRFLGLSELRFVTAAASTGVTIPGLEAAEADALRDRLVALAESRRAGL
ncbi:PH domain-containing protein [Parafrigoribacterium mesophilum]|uniref:PH domain-containing protein n=1 Tax=Parafrigoribacterium mesophilum TaxID=433646 RepID=UPI0031FD0B50